VDIEPIIMDPEVFEKLQSNLLMFYIGSTRKASDVLYDQKQNILSDKTKFNALSEMKDLTIEVQKSLTDSNLDQFGKLLDYNWQLKKSLSKKISRSDIDDIYELGVKNGAIGGKVLGAGGGGFILFYCEELFHNKLRNALKQLRELSFKFARTGSKIIYVGDTLKE
jgi:D-glycero-alpha-D-manno-heptose-7-phosphate kinase